MPLISGPLILEYESVGLREAELLNIPTASVHAIIHAFCYFGREIPVFFRLRPSLPDPNDEFLLEVAVAGRANALVTHNVRQFSEAARFGIPAMTPREFLKRIEEEGR